MTKEHLERRKEIVVNAVNRFLDIMSSIGVVTLIHVEHDDIYAIEGNTQCKHCHLDGVQTHIMEQMAIYNTCNRESNGKAHSQVRPN